MRPRSRPTGFSLCVLLLASSMALSWVPPGRKLGRPAEQLAAVANSLRRERAVLEQKKQQLQRTAAVLQQQKDEIEEDLQNQVTAIRKSKSKAEDALRIEREALQKEKMRLAEESQALVARQQQLMEAAEERTSSGRPEQGRAHEQLIASVNREKAALAREREQLKRQAEAIQAARQQLASSMNRGQEVEDLRTKAEELKVEADALRRERAALERQRRRIKAEAEDIAEEREILEEKAKKIHSANSGKKAIVADKDLLESLRAAETQLAQQAAEFRNFKWRVESESKSIEERALAKAAKPLLLVLDDLNRAQLAGAAKGLLPEDVKQVLRPLRRRLVVACLKMKSFGDRKKCLVGSKGVLESEFNVRPMPNAVGQAFNPELHEAVSLRADEVESDIVVEQLEEGFLYGDSSEVLRPAKVIVSS
eukprot:symbB.v1.2.026727.t1/scaffold2694.1/size91562/3